MRVSGMTFGLVFSAIIAVIMSVSMSFFMLLLNIGLVPGFTIILIKSSAVGFAISLPIAVIAIPILQKGLATVLVVENGAKGV